MCRCVMTMMMVLYIAHLPDILPVVTKQATIHVSMKESSKHNTYTTVPVRNGSGTSTTIKNVSIKQELDPPNGI